MRAVLGCPGAGLCGRDPRQGVADQAAVGGMAERVRSVAGLNVDDRATSGGLGPGDEVAGCRVLPRRAGARRAQHLAVGLPERAAGRVGAEQRDDVVLEDRAAVQLVVQHEVVDPGAYRVVPVDHPRRVRRVPESRIGPGLAAKFSRRVVVAAAEYLSPSRPRRPPGERVVQEHETLARGEQLGQPPGHLGCGGDRLWGGPAPQRKARQVVTENGVEHPAVLRAEPPLRGGLDGVGEHPATVGADVAQHPGERVQIDAVPPGDGQQAHHSAAPHQAPASRARRAKDAPAAVHPPSTTAVRIQPLPRQEAGVDGLGSCQYFMESA